VNPYPPPSDLRSWISPHYWEAFQAGTLRAEFLTHDPYPHCVLPDFFRPDLFERMRVDCDRQASKVSGENGELLNQEYLLARNWSACSMDRPCVDSSMP